MPSKTTRPPVLERCTRLKFRDSGSRGQLTVHARPSTVADTLTPSFLRHMLPGTALAVKHVDSLELVEDGRKLLRRTRLLGCFNHSCVSRKSRLRVLLLMVTAMGTAKRYLLYAHVPPGVVANSTLASYLP